MALKVVTMAEMRFGVLLEVERTGLRVTEVCRRYGISRNTGIDVGIWLKGWRAWRTGLMNRDRLQGRFPPKPRFGSLRCGRIIPGGEPVVSELNWTGLVSTRRAVSTVHQVLCRNGLVATRSSRRPKADKRFEREIANDLWQIAASRPSSKADAMAR